MNNLKAIIVKAIMIWAAILVLAILNGGLREALLIPALGSFAGLIASGLILACCIFAMALITLPWFGRLKARHYWGLGLLWLLLTLLFEFSFGIFVQHKTWSELLAAYTFSDGNIWPLVLLVTLVSPWLAARLRGRID